MAGKKGFVLAFAAVILPCLASGQAGTPFIPKIFLNSDPIGAEVSAPGGRVLGRTPLVLSPSEAGWEVGKTYPLRIRKTGYMDADVHVSVSGDGPSRHLVPLSALLASVRMGDYAEDVGYRLEYGALDLYSREDRGLRVPAIRRRYPRQGLLDGVRVALPFFLGVSALLAVSDITSPRDSGLLVSWELAGSTLVSAGLFGADLWLSRDRRRFLAAEDPARVEWVATRSGAVGALAEARGLLDAGSPGAAAAVLERLIEGYPDSVLAPEATYLLGRLALSEGDAARAADLLGRVVRDLPAAEVYDKACKGLADARALQGDIPGALEALDRMAFLDPSYPPRVIELYRIQLRSIPSQRP